MKRPPEERLSAVELNDTMTCRFRQLPTGATGTIHLHRLDFDHETGFVLGDAEHTDTGDAEHHFEHLVRIARHHARFQHEPEASTRTVASFLVGIPSRLVHIGEDDGFLDLVARMPSCLAAIFPSTASLMFTTAMYATGFATAGAW